MSWLLVAQSGPIRLITSEAPAPVTHATSTLVDPLWVLLGLIGVAVAAAMVLIARTFWLELLKRRPEDAAFWMLAARSGLGPRRMRLLRRVAAGLGEGTHPVALLCSQAALSGGAMKFLKSGPSPRDAGRLVRMVEGLGRGMAGGERLNQATGG